MQSDPIKGRMRPNSLLGVILRTLLSLVLLTFSSLVFGGCDDWFGETDSTVVAITTDYCSTPLTLTIRKKQKGHASAPEILHSYPFKEECTFLDDGFVCHQKGRTILAGTTWTLSKVDVRNSSKKQKCKIPYFSCAIGCSEAIPSVLYTHYDGDCE